MGVKSTIHLSRADAENRFEDLIMSHGNPRYFIYQVIREWSDIDLEEQLEEMKDQSAGGEGFENYRIVDEE